MKLAKSSNGMSRKREHQYVSSLQDILGTLRSDNERELKRGDCARERTEMVEFIALHNLIINSTGKNCRVASTQMVTWLHLQAPKSELHLMSPAVNSDCARLESVER